MAGFKMEHGSWFYFHIFSFHLHKTFYEIILSSHLELSLQFSKFQRATCLSNMLSSKNLIRLIVMYEASDIEVVMIEKNSMNNIFSCIRKHLVFD